MRKLLLVSAAAAVLLSSGIASATDVYTSTVAPGNQNFGGLMAETFTVNASNLVVTRLGAFDFDKNGINAASNIFVQLFDVTAGAAVATSASFAGAAGNGTQWVYQPVASIPLINTHTYVIGAYGFNSIDQNYNSFGGASLLSFDSQSGALTSGVAFFAVPAAFATSGTIEVPNTRYGAGTLTVSAVPEPSTYVMLLAGLGVVGFVAGRRRLS